MRSRGVQPHVVLLQEAFSDEAKQLARIAGYDFVALGPAEAAGTQRPPLGHKFAEAAQWAKGERSGSQIDSGLVMLSDYAIIKTRKYAFPEGACAGFDCLAAKGVLVAWIDLPGAGEPLAIVDAHLNSRRSAHVSFERTDAAYAWQISAVRDLLAREIPSDAPVVFGGDLNAGRSASRRAAFSNVPLLGVSQVDGLAKVLNAGETLPASVPEAKQIQDHNRDKILSRSGKRVQLTPVRAWVPFRMWTSDQPMSDHPGLVVDYRFAK